MDEESASMPQQSSNEVTTTNYVKSNDGIKNFLIDLELPDFVMDVIYWKNKMQSSVAFVSLMILLHSFGKYRFHLVLSTLVLSSLFLTLTITLALHFFKNVNRLYELNPIQRALEYDIRVWTSPMKQMSAYFVERLVDFMVFLQGLTFVRDIPATVRTFIFCYFMYVTNGVMNFNTLLQLCTVVIFIYPYIYSMYQPKIDCCYSKVSKVVEEKVEILVKVIPAPVSTKLAQIGLLPGDHRKKE